MMKYIYIILVSFAITLTLNSCIINEDLELNKYPEYLIVKGDLPLGEFATIDLQYSLDYALPFELHYNKINDTKISNARVILKDSNGIEELLTESTSEDEKGRYYSKLIKGVENTNYELLIDVDDKHYSSTSKISRPIEIDKISHEKYTAEFGDIKAKISLSWKDRKYQDNFYMVKVGVKYFDKNRMDSCFYYRETFLFSDLNNDGNVINVTCKVDPLSIHRQNQGDGLYVSLCLIDEDTYNYFNGVAGYDINSGDSYSVSPGNLPTNIKGRAFGVFNAYPMSTKKININKEDYYNF
ncbi:MAG: DUF4249 family protein [Hyphomicrobiales bacterium]